MSADQNLSPAFIRDLLRRKSGVRTMDSNSKGRPDEIR